MQCNPNLITGNIVNCGKKIGVDEVKTGLNPLTLFLLPGAYLGSLVYRGISPVI
jgi:hypothetical protein